jgi:transposase
MSNLKERLDRRLNHLLREKVQLKFGKNRQLSANILDGQPAKTSKGGSGCGFDAGKKVTGRKRHALVDSLGLILNVAITGGNVQDHDSAKTSLKEIGTERTSSRDWNLSGHSLWDCA